MPRVLHNPRTGERFVIRQSGADTGGELLEFDLFLDPGGHVPAGHLHPRQQERFTVLDGTIRFRLGRRTLIARRGDAVVVPSNASHWFGNCGTSVAKLRVEVRPALRMEELFASSIASSLSPAPWWSRLIDQLLLLLDFRREVGVPHVPAYLLTTVLTPLAWLRARPSR